MKTFAFVFFLFVLALTPACSSNPNKVQELNTKLEVKGSTHNSLVGLNDNGEAVVQHKRRASTELAVLERVTENLRMELEHQSFVLKECRKEIAAKGSGEFPEFASKDVEAVIAQDEKLGLDNGELMIVKTEFLVEKIKAYRAHEDQLRALIKAVKNNAERCEFQKVKVASR